MKDKYVRGNDIIALAVQAFDREKNQDNLVRVMDSFRIRINQNGHLLIPTKATHKMPDGSKAFVAFTGYQESEDVSMAVHSDAIEDFFKAVAEMEDVSGVIINPMGKSMFLKKEVLQMILEACRQNKNKNIIFFDKGDITKIDCECIVNAANNSLLGGGGVDGAIHRAAGPELLEECKALGGCETGQAKITKGYRLRADYVIHTVGPVYHGTDEDVQLLVNCYWNSLMLAKEHDIHSIAFPAISTGAYGYPLEEATAIAYQTVATWMDNHQDYGITVIFSCYDERTYRVFQEVIAELAEDEGEEE